MPLISTTAVASDVTGRSDRDRERDGVARAERADRLAAQLDAMCDDGERELREAVAARDDQQIAWLVLCDRGWPRGASRQPADLSLSHAWLEAWSEQVALPVRITSARDVVKLRQVRRRLERCESDLRRELPQGLWRIIEPLDDTGRSTLAYALHAVLAWCDACSRCDGASRAKSRLAIRFSLVAQHVKALGLTPPAARLDLESWRAVAAAARHLATIARATHAA